MQGIGKAARLIFAGLLAIGILAWQAPAAKAASFMKIEGIQGEATDQKHRGWIDILAVNWSSSSPVTTPRGNRPNQPGRGAGAVSITKRTDKSSAALLQYNSTGKSIEKMYIDMRSSRDRQPYIRYELTNVMITSFEPGGSGGGVPMETITLNYDKIKIDYMPQKPSEKKRKKY